MSDTTRPPESPGEAPRAQGDDEGEKPAAGLSTLGRFVFGKPRDLRDQRLFHQISLVPLLAWVGLGADGLSSSCCGPEEAFRTLLVVDPSTGAVVPHTYLAIPLALLTAATDAVISACYWRLIEIFPHGGGGYLVATKLLGEKAGMVAGSALIVDYVLTITVSVAAAGAALFSLLPVHYQSYRLPFEIACIVLLTVVNLRGVKESIVVLLPIFLTFVVMHVLLILAGIFLHTGDVASVGRELHRDFRGGLSILGGSG